MKIEGQDIQNAAGHAQGAAGTAEPMLRAADNVLGEVGRRLVHGMSREARLVEFKEARFENADDWTAAEDGSVTVNTSVSGRTTIDLSEPVEFIHFGRVYLDRSHLFPSPMMDDAALGGSRTGDRDADRDRDRADRDRDRADRDRDRADRDRERAERDRADRVHRDRDGRPVRAIGGHAPAGSTAPRVNPTAAGRVAPLREHVPAGRDARPERDAPPRRDAPPGREGRPERDAPPGRDRPGRDAEGGREVAAGRDVPAHGLYFRAALLRESVLLGGFIRAQMDALIAEEKSKGVIGVLAQVVADLTGSAGGTDDKPNAVDLNPHLKKVIDAAKKINKDKVDYVALHAAGVELHIARRAYREYLVTELEKRVGPAKTPEPGGGILNDQVGSVNQGLAAGHAWLGGKDADGQVKQDAIPKLTSLVPPGLQDFLSLVQKVSFKAWDVCAALNYEYATRLEPIIEDACRRMTVHSIQTRSRPIFPVWYLEPQPEYRLPARVEEKIFGFVDNPIDRKMLPSRLGSLAGPGNQLADVVTDPVAKALMSYDQKVGIDATLDFLSRPDRYTPGRPFLDDIFLIPEDAQPDVPNATKRARVGWSGGLGQMAVDCMRGALGVGSLPGFLEWIVSKVSTVCAEFVRAVYCKLLVMRERDTVTEAELLEAANRHLVGNVIESILGALSFVDKIRKASIDIPIAEVSVSVDALVGRAKEFAALNLEPFVMPVIKFAMRDLYQMIFAYRQTAIAQKALTMEVHLAQLPTVFSRLFRNLFFPLWDKILERTIEAVSGSLMPRLPDAGRALLQAREQGEKVRGKMVQALAALDTLPGQLPDAGFSFKDPKGSVKQLKKDWNPIVKNAKKAWDEAEIDVTQDMPALDHDELEQAFPVRDRVRKAEVLRVTPDHIKRVARELKWKRPKHEGQTTTSEGGGAAAPGEVRNSLHGDDGAGPASQPVPQSTPYPYGDYPLQGSGHDPGGAGAGGQLYLASAPPQQPPGTVPAAPQDNPEKTVELADAVSPELRRFAQLDVEETAAVDGIPLSGLPPFLGPKLKA